MYEDQEMREEIRSRMKGRIRFNVATDRIEVIVGEPDGFSIGSRSIGSPCSSIFRSRW